MSSPMQRSLALLRERGWTPWIVERRVPHSAITIDFFGIADIFAAKRGESPLLVQTTTRGNQAARRVKILASDHLSLLLDSGLHVVVHGWGLVGRRGERKTWQVTEWEITREMLAA